MSEQRHFELNVIQNESERLKSTDEIIGIISAFIKQSSLRKVAKRIGISPAALSMQLSTKTISDNTARYFGFEKQIVYVPTTK